MTDYSVILNGVSQQALTACRNGGGGTYEEANLLLSEDGVSLVFNTVYGSGDGVPMDIWHHRTLRYTLAGNADLQEVRHMLASGGAASVLIDRVRAGHSVEWDGNNLVGELSEDAQDASEALRELMADLLTSFWSAWIVDDWFEGNDAAELLGDLGLAAGATCEHIDTASAEIEGWAEADRVVLIGDLPRFLRGLLSEMEEEEA